MLHSVKGVGMMEAEHKGTGEGCISLKLPRTGAQHLAFTDYQISREAWGHSHGSTHIPVLYDHCWDSLT